LLGVLFLDGDHMLQELLRDVGWQFIDPSHDGLPAREALHFRLELLDSFFLIHAFLLQPERSRNRANSIFRTNLQREGFRYALFASVPRAWRVKNCDLSLIVIWREVSLAERAAGSAFEVLFESARRAFRCELH
jgi:hypothetical protein